MSPAARVILITGTRPVENRKLINCVETRQDRGRDVDDIHVKQTS